MAKRNLYCFLEILKNTKRKLRTSEILDHTKNYPDLCTGCNSGSEVISAGLELLRLGRVNREIGKGGFLWSLRN
jgi:hypothetical protein